MCGIRARFDLTGSGKKFDVVETLTHIGSGLALLGIATLVTDMVALYVLPSRRTLKQETYREVEMDLNALLEEERSERERLLSSSNNVEEA